MKKSIRLHNVLLFGGVFLLFVLAGCDSTEDRKRRFLLKGNVKLSEGDLQGAIRFYEEAIAVDNAYVDAYLNRGIAYQRLANHQRAIADFSQALQIAPAFEEARYQKAISHLDFGEYYRALEDARALTSSLIYAAKGHFVLGLANTALERYDEALSAFSRAMELEPTNPELWVNRATIHYYKNNFTTAMEDLSKALALNDKEPNAYNLRGLIHFEQGDYNAALGDVEKSIELNGKQPYFYNNRGLYKLYLGQLEEGLEDINYSLLLDGSNIHALRNKGIYYFMKGDKDLARQYLQEVAAKNNSLPLLNDYLEQLD